MKDQINFKMLLLTDFLNYVKHFQIKLFSLIKISRFDLCNLSNDSLTLFTEYNTSLLLNFTSEDSSLHCISSDFFTQNQPTDKTLFRSSVILATDLSIKTTINSYL